MKKISIVIPMHNEAGNLPQLAKELDEVLSKIKKFRFEVILVDDGSSDESFEIASRIHSRHFRNTAIRLSRNFGKEAALSAGLNEVKADAVILMDADLQHFSRYIPEFIRLWESGFDIVSSKRSAFKKRSLGKRLGSYLFYRILNFISDTPMVSQTTDFRLLDKIVVHELTKFTERNRMVRGLIDWLGFRKTILEFEAPERFAGTESYSVKSLFRLAINSFTMFSLVPLRLAGYLGLVLCALFGLLLVFMVLDKFTYNAMGFTSIAFIIVSNSFLIGVVLACLGLIALYIGNIHIEVVNRPLFIVRNVVRAGNRKKKRNAT